MKYEFKKCNKWTQEEIDIITTLFKKYKVCCKKYSKYVIISNVLRKKGFNRTTKAISRKCFRLGLINYIVSDEERINKKCVVCNTDFEIQKRYVKRNNLFCSEKCRQEWKDKVNKVENKTDRKRTYNREYKKKKKVKKNE
jgi:hypothetical protein